MLENLQAVPAVDRLRAEMHRLQRVRHCGHGGTIIAADTQSCIMPGHVVEDSASMDEERCKQLQAFRDHCISQGNASLESYEKATLALFSTALAASVAVAGVLLKDADGIAHPWWLWSSWTSLVLAVVAILISFLLSHKVFEKLRELVDRQLTNPNVIVDIVPPKWLSGTIRSCNWGSLVLFAFGMIFFMFFAASNTVKENGVPSDPKKEGVIEEIRKGNPGYGPPPAAPTPQAPSPQAPSQPVPSQPAPTQPAPSPVPSPAEPTTPSRGGR